jgi:hypothetical protein
MEFRQIFFNEELHKYTDDLNNIYKSVTTVIGEYEVKFDIKGMAKICARTQKGRYKGLTEKDIIKLWDKERDTACAKGNKTHNIQQFSINKSNGYDKTKLGITKNRLLCVSDILTVCNFGEINLDILKVELIKFPKIYESIEMLVSKGYKIYSEIGIYWHPFLISGCIDLLAINFNTNEFIILDWKTNIHELTFESGYYKKDSQGVSTNEWVSKNESMLSPLKHRTNSSGSKYTLQLSLYAYLCELWGLKCKQLALFHITDELNSEGLQIVNPHKIEYWKQDVVNMIQHHTNNNVKNKNTQLNMLNLLL